MAHEWWSELCQGTLRYGDDGKLTLNGDYRRAMYFAGQIGAELLHLAERLTAADTVVEQLRQDLRTERAGADTLAEENRELRELLGEMVAPLSMLAQRLDWTGEPKTPKRINDLALKVQGQLAPKVE